MQSLKTPQQSHDEPDSGKGVLAESGVRAIPSAAREALKALRANAASLPRETGNDGESYRPPVRVSTQQVCRQTLERHLPLVHQVVAPIARRMPANVQRDDLLAAGIFGLVDSLRKNGGDGGPTFEWYARMRIRGAVLDELRAQDWLTRRARDAINAANAAAQQDEKESEGISFVRLDELTIADEQEFFAAPEIDPAATYEVKETFLKLAQALDKLPVRERKVVGMHYFEGVRFKDIGAELGVSEPRVSQLHARALERLRNFCAEKRSRISAAGSREVCRDLPIDSFDDASSDSSSLASPADDVA